MAREGPSLFARLILIAGGLALLGLAAVWTRLPRPGPARIAVTPELTGVLAGHSYAWVLKTPHGAALVDTGSEVDGKHLLAELRKEGLTPEQVHTVLLTHGHTDHWAGAHLFPKARVLVGADDIPVIEGTRKLTSPVARLTPLLLGHPPVPAKLEPLKGGEKLDVDGETVSVLHTPGHTPGSVVYLWRNVLLSGDALMARGDRLDVAPGAVSEDVAQSRTSLAQLRDVPFTRVADGHTGLTENAGQKLDLPR
ncbi:MBL fold metallo-hydrolase [Myxococcaceae bacterium GXIMD 01537]